jgi:hypothetical protein
MTETSSSSSSHKSAIKGAEPMSFPFQTEDPFLFCAYHKDFFPAGNPNDMTAPVRGNGADFDWSKPYRMYHGDDTPGFPSHPHRGFETITCTTNGSERVVWRRRARGSHQSASWITPTRLATVRATVRAICSG